MLFAKCPPPPEPGQPSEHEFRIAGPPELLYKIQNGGERFFCPPVVRRDGHVTTELQNSGLLRRRQTCFLQNRHSFRFP